MTPKRIVGVGSFAHMGGAQLALTRLMRRLRTRGHVAHTTFLYAKDDSFAEAPDVDILLPRQSLDAFGCAQALSRLKNAFDSARPDAVISFMPLGCVIGQIAALRAGVQIRIASQRSPPSTYGALMRAADRTLGARGVYTHNVCVSQAVCDAFAAYPPAYRKRLSVIHNGVEPRAPTLPRAAARARFGLAPEVILAVAVGRLHAQKNYPVLLRAMADVEGVHLAIAGDGPLHNAHATLAAALDLADRVHFLGALAPDDVANLLGCADMFAIPSAFEGQSNALLEAMAAERAIIASDISMQRETLVGADGPCGLLAPVDDAAAWAQALRALRDDVRLRESLGARAGAHVRNRFSVDAMVDAFEALVMTPTGSAYG